MLHIFIDWIDKGCHSLHCLLSTDLLILIILIRNHGIKLVNRCLEALFYLLLDVICYLYLLHFPLLLPSLKECARIAHN